MLIGTMVVGQGMAQEAVSFAIAGLIGMAMAFTVGLQIAYL